MKKVLGLLAVPAMMLVGCQDDLTSQQDGANEEGVVSITLQTPDVLGTTRAAGYTNSAAGGITNVNWDEYDLRYQVAVYSTDGSVQIVEPIMKTVEGEYSDVSFDVRLVNNRAYKFVAWADFVTKGTTTDLHYDTSDLTNITCLDTSDAQLNDESRDAYFVTTDVTVNATEGVSLTLRRPFAKVRVVTTDWVSSSGDGETYMPDSVQITYYGCQRFSSLNAVTGVATGETLDDSANANTTYTATLDKTEKDYSAGYEAESDKNRTLTVDYLLATSEQTSIHFKLTALDNETEVKTYDFKTDVPIQRNYLTTILGNVLTEDTKVTMTCSEDFEEEYNDYDYNEMFEATKPQFNGRFVYIKTPGELVWLSQNVLTSQAYTNDHFDMTKDGPARGQGGYEFVLVNDIDLEGVDWEPINWWPANDTGSDAGTFNGNGHTIRNLKINAERSQSQGLFGATTINVKNLTIENASINNAGNFTGAIAGNSYGDFENCTVKHIFIRAYNYTTSNPVVIRIGGMVGIHNGGDMRDCKAEDVNLKGYHCVGGLSGTVNETGNRVYDNCSVTDAHLWITASSGTGSQQIGAIVGLSNGVSLTLKRCSASNIEYKIGPYNEENGTPHIMVSGEENTQTYGPKDALYGRGSVTVE